MKLSKIMTVVMSAALIFGLASCGSSKPKVGISKIAQHPALDAVEQGVVDYLKEAGADVEFDLQNANNDANTAAQIASIFKDEGVVVAVGIATPTAQALANTLKTTPVVFGTVTDPVAAQLTDTPYDGKNNVTGMCDQIPDEENIAMFKKVAGIKTLGYIYCSSEANSASSLKRVEGACDKLGIKLVSTAVSNSSEVKQAAETIVGRVDGIYLTTDNTVFSALPSLVDVFGKGKKPVFSGDVTGAKNGGCLMASGFNYYKAGRATGEIVYKILNGEDPANISVRYMTEPGDMDLLFDLDVAKNLNITIPEDLLAQANMIYENGVLTEK